MSKEQDDRNGYSKGRDGGSKPKDDDALITTAEAADMLKLSPRTLEKMRQRGEGPEYFKIRNRAWYTPRKVSAFMASTLRKPISDPREEGSTRSIQTAKDPGEPGKPNHPTGPSGS